MFKSGLFVLFFGILSLSLISQCDQDLKMYEHYVVVEDSDSIYFHVYFSGEKDSIQNVLLFSQGSGASPLFQIRRNGVALERYLY